MRLGDIDRKYALLMAAEIKAKKLRGIALVEYLSLCNQLTRIDERRRILAYLKRRAEKKGKRGK